MRPYFAPKNPWHRAAAFACYSCLLLSKTCGIAAPALRGPAAPLERCPLHAAPL
jgi:hypothetical protein